MKRFFFVLSLISLGLSSCASDNNEIPTNTSETAVANFKVATKDGTVNEQQTFTFENDSKNAVSYLWDFGNGVTSTEKVPTYAYPSCGYYSVKLTVTDSNGKTDTVSHDLPALCIFAGHHPAQPGATDL
jgi:PKD repeat protein